MDERAGLAQSLEGLREGLQDLQQAQGQGSELLRSMATDLSDREEVISRIEDELARHTKVLAVVQEEISAVATTVAKTHEAFDAFLERYGRHQVVANAQAELTQLTVVWKADFAQRQHTRSLARGLVHMLIAHAVEHDLVDTATIDACVRERFLSEPTFWLAPAAMAVAARYKGDSVGVSRATAHAFVLDSAKAKLFFALTCSRLGRLSEAAGWMDRYLGSLDRDRLGPEFPVVLDAIANAEVGHEAFTYASEAMARWFRDDPTVFRAGHAPARVHLERWKPRLWELSTPAPPNRFATLRELCGPRWAAVAESWQAATAVNGTLSHLREAFPAEQSTPVRNSRYADSALDHLIDQPEPDEAELADRMATLRALVEHEGDVEAAAAANDGTRESQTLDFATLLELAVFVPEQVPLGAQGRRLALNCVWESVLEATTALADQSRMLMPSTITLAVEGWSCDVPTDPSEPFSGSEAIRSLKEHVERRTRSHVDSVVPLWSLTLGCGALAALDGALLVPFLTGTGRVVFAAIFVLLVLTALLGFVHVPFRKQSLREEGNRLQVEGALALTKALNESARLLAEWRRGLASAAELKSWSPADEQRGQE